MLSMDLESSYALRVQCNRIPVRGMSTGYMEVENGILYWPARTSLSRYLSHHVPPSNTNWKNTTAFCYG